MRVFDHYSEAPAECRGGVVALGNFDGVHLGHQAVIGAAQAIAREKAIPCGVMTFEPHPRLLFKPESETFRLTPALAKARLIGRIGVDFLLLQHFDRAFAALSPQDFIRRVLLDALGVAHVVVGYDYAFGHGRGGNAEALQAIGHELGFSVTCVGPVRAQDGALYSSTRVREALRAGRVREATSVLGRNWEIEGEVGHGDQRGRQLGFPTANIRLDDYMHPAFGVYAVRAALGTDDSAPVVNGVANIGVRPTFDKKDAMLEAHLFDFDGDLYGRHLRIALVDFLRPERKFDGLDALRAQIAEDGRTARAILAGLAE